jgi:hypothetical protein
MKETNQCQWMKTDSQWICQQCGRKLPGHLPSPIRRRCSLAEEKKPKGNEQDSVWSKRPCCSEPPSLTKRVATATKAAIDFAASGFQMVGNDEYQRRLAICDRCDRKQGHVCLECGCILVVKGWGMVWNCPLENW